MVSHIPSATRHNESSDCAEEPAGCSGENVSLVRDSAPGLLANAVRRHQLLRTQRFFVSQKELIFLLGYILSRTTEPKLSLNRPQVGGRRFVHWVEWLDLRFTSVSKLPIVMD